MSNLGLDKLIFSVYHFVLGEFVRSPDLKTLCRCVYRILAAYIPDYSVCLPGIDLNYECLHPLANPNGCPKHRLQTTGSLLALTKEKNEFSGMCIVIHL